MFGRLLSAVFLASTALAVVTLVGDVRDALRVLSQTPPVPTFPNGPCEPVSTLVPPADAHDRAWVLVLGFDGSTARGLPLREHLERQLERAGVDATFSNALAWDASVREVRCTVEAALANQVRPSLIIAHAGHGDTRAAFGSLVPDTVFSGVIALRWWLDPTAIRPDLPDLGYAAFADRARPALVRAAVMLGAVPIVAEAFRPHDEALLRHVHAETQAIRGLTVEAGVQVAWLAPLWSPEAAPYGDRGATQRWIRSVYEEDPRERRRRRVAIRQRDLYGPTAVVRPAVREHLQHIGAPVVSVDLEDAQRALPDAWFADPVRLSRDGAREIGALAADALVAEADVAAILRPLREEFGVAPVAPHSGGRGGP